MKFQMQFTRKTNYDYVRKSHTHKNHNNSGIYSEIQNEIPCDIVWAT